MDLLQRIDQDLVVSMKTGDTTKKDTLRLLKSAIKNTQIDSQKESLTDTEVEEVIRREAKKRRESIETFTAANKPELAAQESAELEILLSYLPEQLSEMQVTEIVEKYLAEHPTTVQQMGQAMGALSAQLKGKADLGLVSKILRSKLS